LISTCNEGMTATIRLSLDRAAKRDRGFETYSLSTTIYTARAVMNSVVVAKRQRTGLGDHVLLDRDVLARLLAIPGLLDPPNGVSAAEALPVFMPIMPASRFSSNLHVRSTFFVKK